VKHDPIVIVGAGPVGLVSALRLAAAGIPSVVLEKSVDIPRDLRATTFHPPTLDMIEDLGLGILEEIEALGIVTPSWQVLHLATGRRVEFPLSVVGDVTRHPYRLQCEQYKLVKALFERAQASPLIDVRLGAEVVAVEQDGSHVHVTFNEGRLTAPYAIGSDGAHSVVRQAIGLSLEGDTYPSLTILVTTAFPFEDHVPNLLGANYVWGPIDSFSMFRLREEWRCTFYPRPGQDEDIALTDDAIQERMRGIVDPGRPFDIRERRGYRIHQRIVPKYRVGRIVLAGDAAHLNAPTGGMGMNGGIHDAVNLTGKLERMLKGESDSLLDVYSDERRPVALEEIIQQAHQNRTRMQQTDVAKQLKSLDDLAAIANDPQRLRTFVLKASMLEGLRRSNMVKVA
jgi:2-polyprenyl-6-methoxyphenol hydroxylase-like FAD-dependent oxidoreductase